MATAASSLGMKKPTYSSSSLVDAVELDKKGGKAVGKAADDWNSWLDAGEEGEEEEEEEGKKGAGAGGGAKGGAKGGDEDDVDGWLAAQVSKKI